MLSKAIDAIKPSIFQIQLQTFHNKMPVTIPLGTAFAVSDDGVLVTAFHVVKAAEDAIAKQSGHLIAAFAGPDVDTPQIKIHAAFTGTSVAVIGRDEAHDLALLKLPTDKLSDITIKVGPDGAEAKPSACHMDAVTPANGEPIAISGYPLAEPSLVTTSGHIASNWTLNNHQEHYLGDITANPGNSGGPVYRLSDSKVIGVCVGGKLTSVRNAVGNPSQMLHSAGLTFIVPASVIKPLLDKVE
jgi:S1-C subfamily serine protease